MSSRLSCLLPVYLGVARVGYHYEIYVWLSGDQRMLLCTVESAEGVASVLRTLCSAERPAFQRIEVQLCRPLGGV